MHRPQQVVGDAGAGELGQPAARQRRALRVDDERVGLTLARRVVVADDHLDAGGLQRGDLGEVGDAAIDGDQQVRRGRVLRDAVGVDAVAVPDPVRDEGRDLRAEGAEPEREHRGAADAVGVVVAVDADAPPAFDGIDEPFGARPAGRGWPWGRARDRGARRRRRAARAPTGPRRAAGGRAGRRRVVSTAAGGAGSRTRHAVWARRVGRATPGFAAGAGARGRELTGSRSGRRRGCSPREARSGMIGVAGLGPAGAGEVGARGCRARPGWP